MAFSKILLFGRLGFWVITPRELSNWAVAKLKSPDSLYK